jgi:hypothetical protein
MKGLTHVSRALAGAAALALAAPLLAQGNAAPAAPELDISKPMTDVPKASEYAKLAQLPDLTGTWYPDWRALFGQRRIPPKLTPAAQAKLDAYNKKYKESGPPLYAQARCLPPGMPGMMQQPYPIDITYQPGRVTIYAEAYEQTRWIYTDGRKLPDDPDQFFNGNSVGHWDNGQLVVDTVGFSPLTHVLPGVDHSDKMKIHERFYLVKKGMLVVEMTITDPEVFTEPYVTHLAFTPDTVPLREYVCAENNRLRAGEGGANIDLELENKDDDPFGPPVDDPALPGNGGGDGGDSGN